MVRDFLDRIAQRPLLLVWLLCVPAVTPLIQPTLTRSADGLLHLYRLVALDHAIHQGAFFPRWLPDLAFGYGLPLFVFYAPLSYYFTEGLNLLGFSAVGALNASFALAILISGTGVYLFVKDLLGARAGLLAGVAYVYAPYQLFNILWRGSLPIAWAGALFPLAFWSFNRLIRTGRPIYLPLSALICGLALLMHNISSLIFLPLLAFYLLLELLARGQWRIFYRAIAALALGLGLAAFFLGPAIIEKEFAQVERVITPPDFDYHFNFVTLLELVSFVPPANTGLLNPDEPFTLGPVQIGLAFIGLLSLSVWQAGKFKRQAEGGSNPKDDVSPPPFRASAPHPSHSSSASIIRFTIISLGVVIFMMLPISVGVWDRLPLIAFVQQPHRLLSPAAFLLAILVGAAVTTRPNWLGFGLAAVGMPLIFVTAIPLLYPRYYDPLPAPPTLSGMMAYEQASGAIGTTSFGEYLPVWVRQIPRESPLEPMYQAGTTVERLDPAYLSPGANIKTANYDFNRASLVIDSPEPYQAIFQSFYFPGWQAQIDGQPAEVAPVSERGLIGLSVPEGEHRLQLQFRETPVRRLFNAVSILSFLGLMATTLYALRFGIDHFRPMPESPRFSASQVAILALIGLSLIALKTLYLDRFDTPLKHVFDGASVASADEAEQVNFGHQVNLLGYDLDRRTVPAGQAFELIAYWQARQPLATNYSALAQLVDEQQHLYAGQDNLHPGNLPTTAWEPWGFVKDPHRVQVPPGTPPGNYFLITGLYEPATGVRLPVIEGGSANWPDVIAIPVSVVKSDSIPAIAELGIAWPREVDVGPALRLLGATPERQVVGQNQFWRLALFWEATRQPTVDYRIELRLMARDDTVALANSSQPSHDRYPTRRWTSGERVRDAHALWLPSDFPAGTYRLEVRASSAESEQAVSEWIEVGQVSVEK